MTESEDAEVVKVCLIGDSSVGKSSISLRFAKDIFHPNMHPTLGVAYLSRVVKSGSGKNYKFQIWDTAGQERYRSLVPIYYHGAAVVLVVYDVTNRDSFVFGAKRWVHELQKVGPEDAFYALVGNKSDREDERAVEEEEGERWAAEMGIIYYETSAKSGYNISELFKNVCSLLEGRSALKIAHQKKESSSSAQNRKTGFGSLFNSKFSFRERVENFKLRFIEDKSTDSGCCSQKCETN